MNPQFPLFTNLGVLLYVSRDVMAQFFNRLRPLLTRVDRLPNPGSDSNGFPVALVRLLKEHWDELEPPVLQAFLEVEALAAAQGIPRCNWLPDTADGLANAIRAWLYRPKAAPAEPPPAQIPSVQPDPSPPVALSPETSNLPSEPLPATAPFVEPAKTAPSGPPLAAETPETQSSITLPPGWEMEVEPAVEPVDGKLLLDALNELLLRFVVLPQWAPQTLALWVLHTYAFELRDVSTYIGLESPTRRCGKTTLLTIILRLVNRPVVAANVSSPAFFRAIEELRPSLLIDEADTFFKANDQLQGILNAGYSRSTAYVLRVHQQSHGPKSKRRSPGLAFFSCWCPKLISRIGRLPETLADRCIIVRMQRKTPDERCERLNKLEPTPLRRQCARFVRDHAQAIAAARPEIPPQLNDRAADIWEPLLALADLAGGAWPEQARQAALGLSAGIPDNGPISSLLLDISAIFSSSGQDRLLTRDLIERLNTQFAITRAPLTRSVGGAILARAPGGSAMRTIFTRRTTLPNKSGFANWSRKPA